MKSIETEILVNSEPDKVWDILTTFENYSGWNPFIRSIKGKRKVGEQLTVNIQPPDSKEMEFKPTILIYRKNEEFRWKGKFYIKGLFDGEHYFKLIDLDNGQTKLIHGELFSGLLVPFMGKALAKTKEGFELMNNFLKKECEKSAASPEKVSERTTGRMVKGKGQKKS
jgi:hypothetical protein